MSDFSSKIPYIYPASKNQYLLFPRRRCSIRYWTSLQKRNEDLANRQATSEDLTSVTVPLSFICLVIFTLYYVAGYFGMRRTNYFIMGAFLIITLSIVGVGFFLLDLVVVNPDYAFFKGPFILLVVHLTRRFSLFNIFLNVSTFVVAVMCIRDFKLDSRKSLFADLAVAALVLPRRMLNLAGLRERIYYPEQKRF